MILLHFQVHQIARRNIRWEKGIEMFVSIIIIELITSLISWFYYSRSFDDCVSRLKIFRRAIWWTWKCI